MTVPMTHNEEELSGLAPDRDLVLAFQRGEKGAYQAIYERHKPRVAGVCRRMLVDSHDAQEAAQETFLRVYQALGRFNGRYELGAWLARIATNVCLDQLRAKSRRPSEVAPLELIDTAADRAGDGSDPEAVAVSRAESRRVRKVLASLPPMHRAAIVLRDFEGLSYAEIAGALHITEAQVKALLHRARQRFKRDWSSVASIFIPVRLIQRLKGVPTASVEGAAYGTTSPQIVATCSAIVQNCGQFIAERVGPTVAALGLTAAGLAGAGAAVASHPAQLEIAPVTAPIMSGKPPAVAKQNAKNVRLKSEGREKAAPTGAAVEPAPAASPTPEASPTEPPEPPADQGAGAPQEDDHAHEPSDGDAPPPPPPPPPPFSPALGFGTPRSAPVRSNYAQVDCLSTSVEQFLKTSISYGDNMYFATLDLDADDDDVDFNLLVYPDGRGESGADVEYEGEGALTAISRSDTRLLLEYSGTFENTDHDAEWKELPEGGTFHITVELDCTTSSVITEIVQFASE